MGFSYAIASFSIFAMGLLPMNCHHKTSRTNSGSMSPAQANANGHSKLHDLGNITLTNLHETSVSLGDGKTCILRPKMTDSREADLTVTLETQSPAGKVQDFMMTEVTAENGETLSTTVGDIELSLTPNVVTE